MSMLDREIIEDNKTAPKIISNIVRVVSISENCVAVLKPFVVLSTAFWLMGLEAPDLVRYTSLVSGIPEKPTKKAQQIVAYLGMTVMLGYVKTISIDNTNVAQKMWKEALTCKNISNLLTESEQTTLWNLVVNSEAEVFRNKKVIRDRLLNEYLRKRTKREKEIPLVQGIMEQLDIVYKYAYLRPALCMKEFIESGDNALQVPAVLSEAKKFLTVYNKIQKEEGANFPLCKLIDFLKHSDLKHNLYPNLYAVSLMWLEKSKKA